MDPVMFETHLGHRFTLEDPEWSGGRVSEGWLVDRETSEKYPIVDGIPRFVEDEGYAQNFGLQWTRFRATQLDSYTGKPLHFNRLWNSTGWKPRDVYGKTVLEAGSGAGVFTEVLLEAGARVVSFDLSRAVESNLSSNGDKGDLLLFQANLYDLPLPDEHFDFVFAYGLLQHTPDPEEAFRALFRKLKPGGSMSLDYYLKSPELSPWRTPKYTWRPITRRMKPHRLLKIIEWYMPYWLPVDSAIRRIPRIGPKLVAFLRIPCWNHRDLGLSRSENLQWAIMNTFDALGAAYDFPKTLEEVRTMVSVPECESGEVFYGSNGVVANVKKA